jgi:hypothetical protein
VVSMAEGVREVGAPVVISSLKRRDELIQMLYGLGVAGGRIYSTGARE